MAELVNKTRTKSVAWDYFGLEKGADGRVVDDGSAVCRLCRKRMLAKHGNISNLFSHLKNNHSTVYKEAMDAVKAKEDSTERRARCVPPVNQPTYQEAMVRSQPYDRKGKKWKELSNSITYFIAKDCLPINTVEGAGFRKMVKTFDSRYDIPSRNHISRIALPSLHATVKQQVKQEISSISHFSSTTDMWSSVGMVPYIRYTIHYISDEWQLCNKCLQTQYLPEDHTGANLAEAMKAALETWNLDVVNQICLTTDNGSNIISAARILDWLRLPCFGHNLHLAVTKAVQDDSRCSRALGVCRKIVSSFSMSWKRKRELIKAQINMDVKQHSLVAISKANM